MTTTKREAIWDAAIALFAEKGIDATTTREIAQLADTAEGNIYRHFKNKDDLIQQVFEESAAKLHAFLLDSVGPEADPRAQLQRLLRGIFDFAEENRNAFAFLVTAPHSEFVRGRDGDWRPLPMRLFSETLEKGFRAGVFRRVHPVLGPGWIVAMVQRAILLGGTRMMTLPREEIISQTIDAAMRVVETHPRVSQAGVR